ncbi:conserved hypothetical protein [Sporisorium reilianum SRZ2]|uniref:Conserved oligomeric Golgi complex subunit 1 n=1 Tax=Sporisorium reilianum (strain SRZ2) TaxID=999809 RepID=E6ZWV6_SPORE|nr:conserved hypothetical protein [Sporisorium reilianum SRZ2]
MSAIAADAGSAAATPAKQGRARHARTNASLTSSSGSISVDSPSPVDRLPRRPSVPNEAARVFQATGFDPFGTEPDTLFRSLTVKEVEAYERAVRSTASGKQEELRSLVGQRYEDLLGTANTIIDMAGSSKQLSQRLHQLSDGVRLAAVADDKSASSAKTNRRKSFLPAHHLAAPEAQASNLHQEAIYVLGASLRLIMDAPEYVWKSIEKGKTLQAAWAFMLARATWWDLIDSTSPAGSQSILTADGEAGITSVSEAVSLLEVNVKKAFPFIEKQWQTMLPMRKQIIHRAVSLLSDTEIESMAVVDQLAALMLLDGTKPEQANHLLLSQRLTAMRRMVQRRQTKSASHHRTPSRHSTAHQQSQTAAVSKQERAAQTSQTISQLVTLFARTLQHAVQIFMLPSKAEAASASASRPLLLDLLATVTDPNNFASETPAAGSPTSERTFLLPQPSPNGDAPTARQNAAALRAQRRRSSYGLPVADGEKQVESEQATSDRTQTHPSRPPLRVSTVSVVEALPSGRILSRLLPPSFWSFTPHLDVVAKETQSPAPGFADLASWSTKARETIIRGSDTAAPVSVRSLLSEMSDVGELALVRSSLRIALHRARRIVARKLAGQQGPADERRKEAVTKIHSELEQFEEAMDAVLQERLLHLMEQKLNRAVKELLQETERIVSSLDQQSESQNDDATRVDTPLDALFHPIEAETIRPSANGIANASSSSRAFTAALQDHVCGRSKQVDRLASLYEAPLATLSEELLLYQTELKADERFAGASDSIQAKFDSILACSRREVETGLNALLEQAQSSSNDAEGQAQVSRASSLVMRIIAVLAGAASSGQQAREPVKAALERFWRPQLERRIFHILDMASASAKPASDTTVSSVSASMLCALATLSESIVQLGPALAGPELAEQVRSVLVGLADNGATSAGDSEAIRALLACDAASLSEHIAADASLHRIRLALAPLVLALATQSSLEAKGEARVLSPAEPASAVGAVRPILTVSRNKVDRFSLLPVR